ncbi:MAG: protein translocase subunit SecD [Chloroflexi bacterium]|nr:protein translocase subunit SecD [Chloroflexota bacterium]
MRQRDIRLLVLIVLVAAFAAWVSWPSNPGIHIKLGNLQIDREIKVHQGLDLQGGMEVLLEADPLDGQPVSADAMSSVRGIVENRVNGLGVTEPVVQSVGTDRILVQLPGIDDPVAAAEMIKETGQMEWVDTGVFVEPGTRIRTNLGDPEGADSQAPVYTTVLTGQNLKSADVAFDQSNLPVIAFELDADGGRIFAAHTAANVGKYLAIVLDKEVISCPQIHTAIPDGRGQINGSFTTAEAKSMVLQLRYGALPVPLSIVDMRGVGPSLGEESVDRSIRAGAIGLGIVLLFMLIYYRLPGLLADLALIIYALVTLSLYKLIPVTLTLPGIAGFLLSVGMAVDANILIFERMREELRAGRTLERAIEAGFQRAWTSILDSNISTWITCAILWFFGNSFGASVVKGFAVTLAIGVFVSMFTAVTVTRTFLRATFAVGGEDLREKKWLLGV